MNLDGMKWAKRITVRQRHGVAVVLLSLLVGGCAGADTETGATSPDLANCLAVTGMTGTGVFGCVTASNDVGNPATSVISGFVVRAFAASTQQPVAGQIELKSTTTSTIGTYTMDLEAGDYWLCTDFFRCTSLTVSAGVRSKRNYSMGVGPGW